MMKPSFAPTFLLLVLATPLSALDLDGFAEPYRTINVSADETGIIAEVLVEEGQTVEAGQPLVRLNSDVHRALLAIAEQNMHAEGRLEAALAEMRLRQDRLEKLSALRVGGHARQEEVDRAAAEVDVAKANVRAAREDLVARKLEYDKIKIHVERRTVRSPISGVVTSLHKEIGEFVAPTTPDLLTLVDLDPLLATFSIMRADAESLRPGQKVVIHFDDTNLKTEGIVDFISPVLDAESGTIRVKVRVRNSENRVRSGERCTLRLPH